MVRLLILPALLALSAGKCEAPHNVCPPLKIYSKTFQAELKAELERIMETSPRVMQVIRDYGVTRDQIRACMK